MTARTFLTKQGWLSEESIKKNQLGLKGTNQKELKYPLQEITYVGKAVHANANILIVNIEALRADMLNPTNMPHLQALADKGINFKNHFSGSDNSKQGVFSLFYGLPNSYWTPVTANHISPVIMDKVNAEKRQIGLFSSIGLVQPQFLQSSFSQLNVKANVHYAKTENNNQVVQQWRQWVSQSSTAQPWFSYLYLEQKNSHQFTQYGTKSIAEQSKSLALYQSQVTTIDEQIERLIQTLKRQKQYDNTIIIVTGTHGQSFNNSDTNDGLISSSHVPMVLLLPNEGSQIITNMTSHSDIAPTLMEEVFSIDSPTNHYSIGQHLLDDTQRQYVLSGDLNDYIIYEAEKITKFSRNGDINSIDWQGNHIEESEYNKDYDITLLIDVLSTLRRFNQR